jgi:hypothetical protein
MNAEYTTGSCSVTSQSTPMIPSNFINIWN